MGKSKPDDIFATKLNLYRCDCGTEGIVVLRIDDEHNDCEDAPFIELAFWQYGQVHIHNWRYKFRQIWRIITEGTPYTDMVCMRREQAKALADGILKKCALK
jgi:hypothetical protein